MTPLPWWSAVKNQKLLLQNLLGIVQHSTDMQSAERCMCTQLLRLTQLIQKPLTRGSAMRSQAPGVRFVAPDDARRLHMISLHKSTLHIRADSKESALDHPCVAAYIR